MKYLEKNFLSFGILEGYGLNFYWEVEFMIRFRFCR